jgi:hypothetical protein
MMIVEAVMIPTLMIIIYGMMSYADGDVDHHVCTLNTPMFVSMRGVTKL